MMMMKHIFVSGSDFKMMVKTRGSIGGDPDDSVSAHSCGVVD